MSRTSRHNPEFTVDRALAAGERARKAGTSILDAVTEEAIRCGMPAWAAKKTARAFLNLPPTHRGRKNPTNAVLEILVSLDPRHYMDIHVREAARQTKDQYPVRGLTFRHTTEGSSPAIAVRFDIDTSDKRRGGSWQAVFRLFQHNYVELGGKESSIIGYTLSDVFRHRKASSRGGATTWEEELAQRHIDLARKKAAGARKPKPVYTKEYLAEKGMPRRNPLEMYRRPDDLYSVSIPFTSSTPLSVEFSKTEPGEQRRFRLLPNSQKEAGWLKPILGKWLSADDALNLAVEAEGFSKDMYSSYPRHEYRDAARFYEGMSIVFFGLAEAVQTPWGR